MKKQKQPPVVEIYDTTLRDGSQQAGISFSLHDKLAIARRLDRFGVDYIELGWPGASEKDTLVFREAQNVSFENAKIVAFGMTCTKGKRPEDDKNLLALLYAGTDIIALFGKSSRRHVEKVLCVSLQENLRLIEESCKFFTVRGKEVFFDAEHFFDGFKEDPSYTILCVKAAVAGGASRIVLCDTNGGCVPSDISVAILALKKELSDDVVIGIHTHNDGEMAVANSLLAVEAGARQIQVTVNGYGERCGNANLCSVVPNLKIKMGIDCNCVGHLDQLTGLARYVAEVANLPFSPQQPYVGRSAFHHKAGLHVNAIAKDFGSYHHIDPHLVGNSSSVVVSELSGKSNIEIKAREFGIDLSRDQIQSVLAQVESKEKCGFQFEGADISLRLIMARKINGYVFPFNIVERDIRSQQSAGRESVDRAIVRVVVNKDGTNFEYHVADGEGPVNALDNAIRKSLLPYFPYLENLKLVDYKVRVLPGKKGTAKAVRILIDFSDGQEQWTTVGCSTDTIEASLQALVDGFEYAIISHVS